MEQFNRVNPLFFNFINYRINKIIYNINLFTFIKYVHFYFNDKFKKEKKDRYFFNYLKILLKTNPDLIGKINVKKKKISFEIKNVIIALYKQEKILIC